MSAVPARAQLLDQFLAPDIGGRGIEPGVTVASRERPDYEAGGIRAGSFIVRPELSESAGYESNVLGTGAPHGSPLVRTNATVDVTSDVSRVTLQARLNVDDTRYTDLPQQSFTNWSAALAGSYELGRDTASASYTHLNLNQTVRDIDVPQLGQPLAYRVDTGRLDYRMPINRVFLLPGIEISRYDYDNGTAGSTGTGTGFGGSYQQDYRNRVVVTPSFEAGYEFSPRRSALVVVRDSVASYTNQNAGLPTRDYNDGSVLGGLDYDLNGLIRFRILGGYEVRTFTSRAYKTIQAPVVEGTVTWTPTGLTTVTGTARRRIEDSADETTASFTETSLQLRVDHEYLRNVRLQANTGFYYGEYGRGGGQQALYTFGTGAEYLLNRRVALSLTYDFAARTSSGGQATSTTLGAGSGFGATGAFAGGSGGPLGTTGQQFGSSYTDHRILLQLRLRL